MKQESQIVIENKIRTYSGELIDITDPNPADILIEDIAHALSNQCRFAGHTSRFYSVAEHSLNCMRLVSDSNKIGALLHDASEAYLVDLPRPIKMRMAGYQFFDFEEQMERAIAQRFKFQYPYHKEIKDADNYMLKWEWEFLIEHPHKILPVKGPKEMEREFLKAFKLYGNS